MSRELAPKPEFHALLAFARAMNVVRFALENLTRPLDGTRPAHRRRLAATVFLAGGLLNEVRISGNRLGEWYRDLPEYSALAQPMPAELLTQWLAKAEEKAELPKLAGSMWQAYRRKFATERMHHPLRAVADAGGWKDVTTLLTCYQQTDDATLLAVMGEPRKISERRTS